MSTIPIKLDAPFYTDAELDALYETDPVAATRISREQYLLGRTLGSAAAGDPDAPPPAEAEVRSVLEEARRILARDGGALELVALEGRALRVRLAGACAGCPRAPLDARNIVEALVRRRLPGISEISVTF